jgi:glycosyltransferase involved in cell wall biosynthesis
VISRVLLTADTVGGVWSHALELARALHGRGIDVLLAAMGPPPSAAQEREAGLIEGLELRAAPWKLPWMDDPWDDVARAGDWLLDLATSWNADLAHLSEPVLAALPWEIPTLAVGHSCVRSWFEAVRGTSAPPEWDRYGEAMSAGFRAAGAVVAPSHAMLDALRQHYGVRRGTVVPNGRDPARYLPAPKEPIVLTAGRLWDPAKNLALLTQAAPALPWPVYAAGDTTAPEGGAGLDAGGVRLLGTLDSEAMAAWMGRAAVFALPARYEPFGLTVLEAALSGCALVLGDIASLRELWDGVAIFVPPGDTDTCRAALTALADDPGLRQTLAMRARRRALGFSPERMTAGYLGVYARLLEEAPACAS